MVQIRNIHGVHRKPANELRGRQRGRIRGNNSHLVNADRYLYWMPCQIGAYSMHSFRSFAPGGTTAVPDNKMKIIVDIGRGFMVPVHDARFVHLPAKFVKRSL